MRAAAFLMACVTSRCVALGIHIKNAMVNRLQNLRSSLESFFQCVWRSPLFGALAHRGTWSVFAQRRPRISLEGFRALGISLCSEKKGQASVEAALVLPILLLALAILLQPIFVLYTRAVMHEAAAEGVRVLMSYEGSGAVSQESVHSYIQRRLSAVPNIAAFHTGGLEGWLIAFEGSGSTQKVSVKVEGCFRPLPILGIVASMLGEVRGNEVVLTVQVDQFAHPSWLQDTYSTWVSEWD